MRSARHNCAVCAFVLSISSRVYREVDEIVGDIIPFGTLVTLPLEVLMRSLGIAIVDQLTLRKKQEAVE
jgi:hypothetical protein